MPDRTEVKSSCSVAAHSRRSLLKSVAACAATALTPAAFARAGKSPKRPNIIYILADDLGWGDLDCYNKLSAIPTPHANSFARQSLRFTDMHAPSAVCTPSRYGILTGRYCWRGALKKGVLWGYSPNLIEPGRLTVPGVLQKRGYYTAGVGKWHLGLGSQEKTDYTQPLHPSPVDHGFDYFYGIPGSLDMDPYLYFENDRVVRQPTETIAASDSVTATDSNQATTAGTAGSNGVRGVFWRGGAIAPGFKLDQVLPTMTQKACDVIRERAKSADPFFLYFALPAPHTPWLPSKEFLGRSHAGRYGDYVAQVDDVFGQVLRVMDEAGITGNTLVIITSDNGADWKIGDKALYAHRANGDWRGEKADIWDAGHRVPFMARWPGRIAPGTTTNQLGCLTDLMATVADIVDFRLPNDAGDDSFDLLPILHGSKQPVRKDVVHHSYEGMFGLRSGDWKIELGLGSGGFSDPVQVTPAPDGPQGQLYNLHDDPGEKNNLWLKRPEIVGRLTATIESYKRMGHTRPLL